MKEEVIYLSIIGLPVIGLLFVGWIFCEFRSARWLRITSGFIFLIAAFMWCMIMGFLQRHNTKLEYEHIINEMINKTITELEAGHTAHVLNEMEKYSESTENFGVDTHLEFLRETSERLGNPSKGGEDPRLYGR